MGGEMIWKICKICGKVYYEDFDNTSAYLCTDCLAYLDDLDESGLGGTLDNDYLRKWRNNKKRSIYDE